MKMKLSRYWWHKLYFLLVLEVILIANYIYVLIDTNSTVKDFLIGVGIMVLQICTVLFLPFTVRRFLMIMEIQEDVMRSFLFRKLKCEVFTDRDIFYAIFDCREVNGRINQYIVVSNEMFVFEDRKRTFWSENRFIDYYDRTKQIIFPYDEKTKHLFAIEKWKCVN